MLLFPPYSRLVRLVFRSLNQMKAENACRDAFRIVQEEIGNKGDVLGPAECPIFMTSKQYRYQIILRSRDIALLQNAARKLLYEYTHNQAVYIECDVDPVSIL